MTVLGIKRLEFVTIYTRNLAASNTFYVGVHEFPLMREVPDEFFQISVAGVPICVDLSNKGRQQNNIRIEVDDLSATAFRRANKG